MPTTLVSDVLTEAVALLNDTGKAIYTDVAMIPLVDKAYRELQKAYADNGVQLLDEVSAVVDVPVSTVTLDPQVSFGADFILPVWLRERPDGSTDENDWVDMVERAWEPMEQMQTTLDVWAWREQAIKFRGATTIREIKVRYKKALTKLTAAANTIAIEGAQEFLSARSAAIAAAVIGENMSRAEVLQEDANAAKETLLSIHAKKRQNIPIRRKRYRRPRSGLYGS
jgi:hypothetical protein